jgi:hypothetical protein
MRPIARDLLMPLLVIALTSACAPQAATQSTPTPSLSGRPSSTSLNTASAVASPSASSGMYSNATLGYRVVLPASYRLSSCGPWVDFGMDRMGADYFTTLSDRAERELNVGGIPPRERASDFSVSAHRNADGKSAVEWARAQPGNRDSTVGAITIGGREAARIVSNDRTRNVSFAVRADGRIYSVATHIGQAGVDTEPLLTAVAASLEPIALGPFPTPSTKAPREAAQAVATAVATAFRQRDAAAVSLQMHGCLIGMHAVIDPPQPDNTCCVLNRSTLSFIEALRPAFASGGVTLVVDPTVQAASEGGRERFFVVSRWTEDGNTRQVDLFVDQISGQWLWSGAVHHFPRGEVCYGPIWGGASC